MTMETDMGLARLQGTPVVTRSWERQGRILPSRALSGSVAPATPGVTYLQSCCANSYVDSSASPTYKP